MRSRPVADHADRRILRQLTKTPNASILALAEATGLARNTVRSHLGRFDEDGTLRSFQRRIDPRALGFPLDAYVLARVVQRKLAKVGSDLAEIPEVTEVVGLSGISDLLIHIVARDTDDLYRVAGRILDVNGIKRTTTGLVMREIVPHRIVQLV